MQKTSEEIKQAQQEEDDEPVKVSKQDFELFQQLKTSHQMVMIQNAEPEPVYSNVEMSNQQHEVNEIRNEESYQLEQQMNSGMSLDNVSHISDPNVINTTGRRGRRKQKP